MARQRSRSPRRDAGSAVSAPSRRSGRARGQKGDAALSPPSSAPGAPRAAPLEDGRSLAALLATARPRGLLTTRAQQLTLCGLRPEPRSGFLERLRLGNVVQGLRTFFQRLWGPASAAAAPAPLPASEKASRLLLACWAAVCSWDPGFIAAQAWEQAAARDASVALDLLKPLVPEITSVFGLFALLQVVLLAPHSQAQTDARRAVVKQMMSRLRAAGATCPVCLEELGETDVEEGLPLIVMPCGHPVHFTCYASAVRAKACAGRCLTCREVCNWSNIMITDLREHFGDLVLSTFTDEACAISQAGDTMAVPPPEFLLASICADISEHLPYLMEVSMTPSNFMRMFKACKVELSPQGSWVVTEKLDLPSGGRGYLAGPGQEFVAGLPGTGFLPVASTLVAVASVDGKVRYNEFELHDAAAFTPETLFALLGGETLQTTWKVPFPMKLLWNSTLQEHLEAAGVCLDEALLFDILESPELEIFGRLSMFDESDDSGSE